jgi:cytochrome c oxidase cbb3-type subunit 3
MHHGGTVKDIFKTIKYGVPDKGMIAWEKTMRPKQIAAMANYILTLQGSNPAGAKAPQGKKL